MEEDLYWLALHKWNGIGPRRAKQLCRNLGNIRELFEAPMEDVKDAFQSLLTSGKNAWDVDRESLLEQAEKEREKARRLGFQVIGYSSDDYPMRFRQDEDLPIVLFYKGSVALNARRTIGIVGTRSQTENGAILCEQLVADLAAYDPIVISGLAYGVDVTSHRSALEQGLDTIGVMGTGYDRMYPSAHKNVASKMVDQGGLLTQLEGGLGPEREHFPMRNHLIAALSDGLVVVESKEKGGSMITADLAFKMKKQLFAFPGRPGDELSRGCNALIKSKKAHLIEGGSDIAKTLSWEALDVSRDIQRQLFVDLTEGEEKILGQIRSSGEMSIDQLSYTLEEPVYKLSSVLLELELKGMVKSLPGNRFRAL